MECVIDNTNVETNRNMLQRVLNPYKTIEYDVIFAVLNEDRESNSGIAEVNDRLLSVGCLSTLGCRTAGYSDRKFDDGSCVFLADGLIPTSMFACRSARSPHVLLVLFAMDIVPSLAMKSLTFLSPCVGSLGTRRKSRIYMIFWIRIGDGGGSLWSVWPST